VIFDILVYKNEYLVKSTFEDRVKLLDEIFGVVDFNDYFYKISENIFRVKTFYKDFEKTWHKIVNTEKDLKTKYRLPKDDDIFILEGLVLKKIKGKLEKGFREKNNVTSQVKCRKPARNYHF
jgi:hypothetical protein